MKILLKPTKDKIFYTGILFIIILLLIFIETFSHNEILRNFINLFQIPTFVVNFGYAVFWDSFSWVVGFVDILLTLFYYYLLVCLYFFVKKSGSSKKDKPGRN